jgi:G3E family GTPase
MSSDEALTRPARYIMIGGFLGSGKTTSVARLAKRLAAQGLRVGLITNDQGHNLVDTALLRSHGFVTEEISGGCFCCRFNSLLEAANRLTISTQPDVFIAEPVGSCTDLVATVSFPLRRLYGENYVVAPLSVLIDPMRALRIFQLESGGHFSPKVTYIYRKQLEEADLIVMNKCDLLSEHQREQLRRHIAKEFPNARIHEVSARTGDGLDLWFDEVTAEDQRSRSTMEVDYDIYADGEAMLGWLNCTVRLTGPEPFDANLMVTHLAKEIQQALNSADLEIAHLKMTFSADNGFGDLAAVNLVRNDFVPELSLELAEPISGGELVINLRAEAAPENLREAVIASVETYSRRKPGLEMTIEHLECFKPGKPQPTHRLFSSSEA